MPLLAERWYDKKVRNLRPDHRVSISFGIGTLLFRSLLDQMGEASGFSHLGSCSLPSWQWLRRYHPHCHTDTLVPEIQERSSDGACGDGIARVHSSMAILLPPWSFPWRGKYLLHLGVIFLVLVHRIRNYRKIPPRDGCPLVSLPGGSGRLRSGFIHL